MKLSTWLEWHTEYDEPESRLSRRLAVVQQRLREILDRVESKSPRWLDLCAGEGRDLLPVLSSDPTGRDVQALLIELDPVLAERAQRSAADAVLENVRVRCADAGDVDSFADWLPVDVLMLCGIFGNVHHTAVRDIVAAVPAMVVPGGYVIWTRGGGVDTDPRSEVRTWFTDLGMPEVSFDGHPETYGVGVNNVVAAGGTLPSSPLFTFQRT